MTVRAIYENGVFRPTEPVDLPEKARVEFEPKLLAREGDDRAAQERIYALLGQSFPSGETDVAERHNEHQP
ncbi:MAG TPA: antitoxin family protein [Tepidisphaeraceae bacterium]|nr:antitoxin family protein [Tepidisphaeraceae bacterium]